MPRPYKPEKSDDKRRAAQREPQMAMLQCVPDPPPEFNGDTEAQERWDELCGLLLDSKMLARVFLPTIAEACHAYSMLKVIRDELNDAKRKGVLVVRTGSTRKPHPMFKELSYQQTHLLKLLTALGMSPASRKAINIPVDGRTPLPVDNVGIRPSGIDDFGGFDDE